MIGAIYPRTSKETDDAFSVSSQVDASVFYAKEHDISVPKDFIFREDYTGKALDRPEYNKVRELIHAGKIKALIIYAVDRLARKVGIGEVFLDELFANNVQLHIVAWGTYVKDTPEDRLRFNLDFCRFAATG
jgi:site-specific DNA recombinase